MVITIRISVRTAKGVIVPYWLGICMHSFANGT